MRLSDHGWTNCHAILSWVSFQAYCWKRRSCLSPLFYRLKKQFGRFQRDKQKCKCCIKANGWELGNGFLSVSKPSPSQQVVFSISSSLAGVKKGRGGEGRGRKARKAEEKASSLPNLFAVFLLSQSLSTNATLPSQLFVVPISQIILAMSRPFHVSFSRSCSCLNFRPITSSETRACYADCIVTILKRQLFLFYLVEHFTHFQVNIDFWDGIASVQWQTIKFLQVCVLGVKWIP